LADELVADGVFSSKTVALNIFSYGDMYRTASILDDILDRCSATTLAMSATAPYDAMAATVLEFRPNMLLGTPSKLILFAKYLQGEGVEVRIERLLFAGEFLLPSQQKILTEVFHTTEIYSLYGSAETGIWGWAHYSENPHFFHFLNDIVIEINHPNEEGFGEIVVTNLLRKRFPIIRYKMGDVGKLSVENGREILALKEREQKSFSLHDSAYFLHDFEPLLHPVDCFQIQLSLTTPIHTEIKFLLVKSGGSNDEKQRMISTLMKGLNHIIERDPKFASLVIEFVEESDFYTDRTTSKTPIIIDFRN
jgi:phenylacetate-CoA ligase